MRAVGGLQQAPRGRPSWWWRQSRLTRRAILLAGASAILLFSFTTVAALVNRNRTNDPEVAGVPKPVKVAATRRASGGAETPTHWDGRELRVTSFNQMRRAFADNPQRARREYSGLRWRLHVRVDDINTSRIVLGIVFSGDAGAAAITMRSNGEVEKLSRSKPVIISASGFNYTPGASYQVGFDDGVFVEQASDPPSTPVVEGTQELRDCPIS